MQDLNAAGPPIRPLHSVAMIGVVERDGAVLLTQRADNGLWETPAGVLEKGEGLRACVEREVLEETGVAVRAVHITAVYKNMAHPLTPVSIAWRCEYVSGEPGPTAEARNVAWVRLMDLPGLLRPAHLVRVTDALEYGKRGYPAVRLHDGTTLMVDEVA